MKVKYAGLIIIILLGILVVGGCESKQSDKQPSPALPASKVPDELSVGLAELGEINTLDPARAATGAPVIIVWQLYDRLVGLSPDGQLAPAIAESWRSNPTQDEWHFKIRGNASFSSDSPSGKIEPITPADVKASIERALRIPGFARTLIGDLIAGGNEFASGKQKSLTGLSVKGNEVIFRLTRPFAFLPERLSSSFFSIIPAQTPDDPKEPPGGSGPYHLANWDRVAQKVVIEKNPRYWNTASHTGPKRIVIRSFSSSGPAVEELRGRTIQWLESTSTAIPILKSGIPQGIELSLPPNPTIRLVALNMKDPILKKTPWIGEFLNLATDRGSLVQALGGGDPLAGPIPDKTPANCGFSSPNSSAKATELFKSHGGVKGEVELLVQPGEESRVIAELLRTQWEKAGLRVSLKGGLADFFDRIVAGRYQLALAYFGPFVPTPEEYLWPYRQAGQPVPNVMGYSSKDFDLAYSKYTSAQDKESREKALEKALLTLCANPPVVWLLRPPAVVAAPSGLHAYRVGSIPVFYLLKPK